MFLTRCDTNQAAQPNTMTRGLRVRKEGHCKKVGLHIPYSYSFGYSKLMNNTICVPKGKMLIVAQLLRSFIDYRLDLDDIDIDICQFNFSRSYYMPVLYKLKSKMAFP